jgi:uncharacterized protein YbjT (DUF2867 family)
MVDSEKPVVTVTGITGFLGSHVAQQLVQSGKYTVRGTVRSKTAEGKLAPVREGMGADIFNQIELVEADLMDEASLEGAIKGSRYVIHTASPFVLYEPENEEELLGPAI